MRRAPRLGRGDLLEDCDQPRDVDIERLIATESGRLGRHGSPRVVVGHVVERGDQLAAGGGLVKMKPSRPFSISSLAPFCAVVITGSPQARASITTSEHGS